VILPSSQECKTGRVSDNPKSTVTRLLGAAALAVCSVLGVVAPAAASTPWTAAAVKVDGMLGATLVAGAAVLAVLVVLLLPMLRRRAGDQDPDEGISTSTEAITLPTQAELQAESEPPTPPKETNP
jgi:hypothetical protein